MKIFTSAVRVNAANGERVYLHVNDDAFVSNVENTTRKRELVAQDGQPRVNFSYKGENIEGDRVFTIQRRIVPGIYASVEDTFYPTRRAATVALRAMGGGVDGDDSLCIYSFRFAEAAQELGL